MTMGERSMIADSDLAAPGSKVRVGLVGAGIQASRSPAMHIAEGTALGLDYEYVLFDSDRAQSKTLDTIVSSAEAEGFAGLNVTFPFKQQALGLVDELSDAARRVNAINTIVFRDGRRYGHNTDLWGFKQNIELGLRQVRLGSVLLIGAGGAGAAAAHGLRDLGAERLLIFDMRHQAAQELAESVNSKAGDERAEIVEDLVHVAGIADGIVNATPVGMAKHPGTPLPVETLDPHHWVAEIVYFPLSTALLQAAEALGCRTVTGEGMAIFQAVRAFELFTGLRPDPERMKATFRSLGHG